MRIDSDPSNIAGLGHTQRKSISLPNGSVALPSSRGVDTVSFSKYVIRSRAEARAEAALANAQKAVPTAPKSIGGLLGGGASASADPATPPAEAPATATALGASDSKGLVQDMVKRVYGQKDLDAVTAAWGATRGDRGYNTIADPNNDGVVNFDDQNFILANWGQPVQSGESIPAPDLTGPFAQQHLDAVKERFGAKAGDENYLEDADANGDGVIDFNDITHVIANWGQPRATPSGQ